MLKLRRSQYLITPGEEKLHAYSLRLSDWSETNLFRIVFFEFSFCRVQSPATRWRR